MRSKYRDKRNTAHRCNQLMKGYKKLFSSLVELVEEPTNQELVKANDELKNVISPNNYNIPGDV